MDFGFQWHLTDRCNLRCKHCYQDDFTPRSERSQNDLKEMANRIFHTLRDRSISINLTGGEPLLLPSLLDLVEHLHTFEHLKEIHIITNGTFAENNILTSIRRFPKIKYFKVSLESANPATHDSIRGPGNFEKVRNNIKRVQEIANRPVVLMMTLGRYNFHEIDKTVEFTKENKVDGIIFERFVPLGNGRGILDQVLDATGWRSSVEAIVRAAGLDVDFNDLLPYRAFWLWTSSKRTDPLEGAFCNLGEESMALMPDGTIYPCRRLPVPVGNILSSPFDEIHEQLKKFSVPALRQAMPHGKCKNCLISDCAGCRALSYALTNNLYADDPQCPLAD
jgi:radical SAM protein with 4Fe4S-binding SPASM domain